MKKFGVYALATAAALAFAPAANAAQYLTISGPSGTYGDDTVTGSFERVFTFGPIAGYQIASLDLTSIATSAETDVNFTSATFNGVAFNVLSTGTQEFRNLLNQALINGTNTIRITGTSGANGAFSGTISLAAVPEPATWALMLGGFGLVGTAIRRRAKVAVAFA
jgi:hypothetical protein